ncbi:MAG TPA: serine/threonine-protein kinase, partial [Chroococcales cyanobacterium]
MPVIRLPAGLERGLFGYILTMKEKDVHLSSEEPPVIVESADQKSVAEIIGSEPPKTEGSVTAHLSAGTYIGGMYRVVELIGEGGMGAVYKVHHESLNQYYALKIIKPEMVENSTALARFDAEAKALARIKNPHIVGVHNYGISESGAPYLVTDLLEGLSLEAEIKNNGVIQEERCVGLFKQICQGLFAAHENGVIHRDLKPSNIM